MLFDARAHIGRLNDSAQTFGSGDGLQARHADSQNDNTGRLNGTRSRHEHGEKTLVFVGRHHDRFVAGNVGLRRQHIHALSTGGSGRGFKRKTGEACASQLSQTFGVKRIEHAHQGSAGGHEFQFISAWCTDLEDQLTSKRTSGIGDLNTHRFISGISDAGSKARTRLNLQGVALGF